MTLPLWAAGLLGIGALLVLTLLWMMISQYLGFVVALVVVGGLAFLLYRAWATGDLGRFIDYARENRSVVVPVLFVLVGTGAYLAYYATLVPVVDVSFLFSYKVVGSEGLAGALLGAKMDVNSITYQFSVIKAYRELPFLVSTEGSPELEDGPGPGYYLEVYVLETGERYYLPFRYVNVFTRYLLGGQGSDMFYITGLKLSPDYKSHVLVVRVLENGRPIWEHEFVINESAYTTWEASVP